METKPINVDQFETLLREADCVKINGEVVEDINAVNGTLVIEEKDGTELFFNDDSGLVLWMGDTSTFVKTSRGNKIYLYKCVAWPVNVKTL